MHEMSPKRSVIPLCALSIRPYIIAGLFQPFMYAQLSRTLPHTVVRFVCLSHVYLSVIYVFRDLLLCTHDSFVINKYDSIICIYAIPRGRWQSKECLFFCRRIEIWVDGSVMSVHDLCGECYIYLLVVMTIACCHIGNEYKEIWSAYAISFYCHSILMIIQ